MPARDSVSTAIRNRRATGQPALIAYITAGFPKREGFIQQLHSVASVADVVEIGVPFTDPMADGTTSATRSCSSTCRASRRHCANPASGPAITSRA